MNWLADNWLWILVIGGFIGLHLIGHKVGIGCCGHSHQRKKTVPSPDALDSDRH